MQNKADWVDYSKYIEHSLLRPDASEKDILIIAEKQLTSYAVLFIISVTS